MLKMIVLILVAVSVASCTSYRNANEKGYSHAVGGYTDEKIHEGIFKIVADSGLSPITRKSAVVKVWRRRAAALCKGPLTEIRLELEVLNQGFGHHGQVLIPSNITSATGFAVCSSFAGTMEEAEEIIDTFMDVLNKKQDAKYEALVNQYSDGCTPTEMSLDKLEQVGNAFFKHRQYKIALTCFLRVYESDKETLSKVGVYHRLGLMYDMGLGVDEDLEEAKKWYGLAGRED